jgi:hypothetical protein
MVTGSEGGRHAMMEITFTGELKARAGFEGLAVETSRPLESGAGAAPDPFAPCLASPGTCAS